MQVQEIDFPSDPQGELGNLRNALVQALHRADSSVTAAKLLASTLAFTASRLRTIYKEDGIKSKSQEKRDAKEEKRKKAAVEGLKKTAEMVAEAKAGLAGKLAAKAAFYAVDKVKEKVDAKPKTKAKPKKRTVQKSK